MKKILFRYIVIALAAIALGALIYCLNQPANAASLGTSIDVAGRVHEGLGGEHSLDGGSGLLSGMFGLLENLLIVGMTTVAIVSLRKLFACRQGTNRG